MSEHVAAGRQDASREPGPVEGTFRCSLECICLELALECLAEASVPAGTAPATVQRGTWTHGPGGPLNKSELANEACH